MQVTLLYFDPTHRAHGKELPAGQRALFGRGDRADFPVSGDDIAAVHFAIENDGRDVWVHRLAESMAPVLLNERPVEKSEISDGDTVAAGNTRVRVEIRGRDRLQTTPRPTPSSSIPPETKPAATPQAQIVNRRLPTGLVMYHDPSGGTSLADVLEMLLVRCEPLLIANFRATELKPPDWLVADDLLAAAPAEISASNSLHLIAPADARLAEGSAQPLDVHRHQRGKLLELYHELRTVAAAVLVFAKTPKEEILKAIGFRRAFYCSADGLETFLVQGSRDLAQALMDSLHAILIAGADDAHWRIYANPALAQAPADLGLPTTSESTDTSSANPSATVA